MSEKSRFKGSMTAAEAIKLLESDPEWVARRDARERWRQAQAKRFAREEAPLVQEIKEAGLQIDSVADLINTREPYPEAIPVLLSHVKKTSYRPELRDAIARALTVKGYPEILPEMIEAFRRDPEPRLNGPKWAMGNAIEVLFEDRYVEEIAALARDASHGEARSMVVRALGKSKSRVAEEALTELLSDPQMRIYAEDTIKRRDRRRSRRKSS